MKKSIVTLLLLTVAIASFSQIGLKLGPTVAQLYDGVEPDFEPKFGVVTGVYDRIYLSERFSIQPELLYHNKGSLINYLSPERQRGNQFRQNMKYVELPVSLNFHLGNFELHGGYYIAWLMKMNIRNEFYEFNIKTQNLNLFNRLDHGINYGASFDAYGLIFQANATYGLRVVGKDGQPYGRWNYNDGSFANQAYKNKTFELSVLIPAKIHERKKKVKEVPLWVYPE